MPIRMQKRYTREEIMASDDLYIFGDNLVEIGYGGQAGEARGCPNTLGIPTMISASEPATLENMSKLKLPISLIFLFISLELRKGRTVIWPADGVGTGIANLAENCPELLDFINIQRDLIFETYGGESKHDDNS